MATNKNLTRLAILILALAGVWEMPCAVSPPARAGDWLPMLPDQDFYDFQLFAPPDMQDYELYPEPSEGFFFNYDRLYWGITPPKVSKVGETNRGGYLIPTNPISPQAIVQLNNGSIQAAGPPTTNPNGSVNYPPSVIGGIYQFGSDPLELELNTSWLRTDMSWGNRYEGGWIYDNRGITVGYFDTGEQPQSFQTISEFAAASPQQIFTQSALGGGGDGGGGGVGNINQALATSTIISVSPPPDHLIAQKLVQKNTTRIQSAAVTSLIRREIGGRGSRSHVKFSVGPRFVQFEDRFNIGYESNQYAFNTAGYGGGTGAGGVTGGATGGVTGGTTGGTTGGATGGTTGGATGTLIGDTALSETSSSAGDFFGITGVDTLTGKGRGSPLQTGAWESYTTNNMVGPEFALMMEAQSGRWSFSSQFKFTAAFNWQNSLFRGSNFPDSVGADYIRSTFTPASTVSQDGQGVGSNTQTNLVPPPLFLQLYGVGQNNATNSAEHSFVFSPIGEWRLGTQFRVSQAISLNLGYTGLWMAGIARASSNTGYKTDEKRAQYAEPKDPARVASLGDPTATPPVVPNPWVVKSTGVGVGPEFTNPLLPNGQPNPYFRENPRYDHIAPVRGGTEYVFTNGVDFGIEVKY